MGTCFKNFKGTLYKNFVLQNKEPDFDGGQFSKQKDFWQAFKEYRLLLLWTFCKSSRYDLHYCSMAFAEVIFKCMTNHPKYYSVHLTY